MISINPIPAFRDNYIWCLHDATQAWVVDPGDAAPVLSFLNTNALSLQGILVTHHHADHTGGIASLRKETQAQVLGPRGSPFGPLDRAVAEGDQVSVLGLTFSVIPVPGHTLDHIAWFSSQGERPLLFCGDTLFSAGCGRLFEGSPQQMHASLLRLAALPAGTAVYCAHEYTLSNLAFAAAVLGEHPPLQARLAQCQRLREEGRPTLPVTLGEEKSYNPFLLCDDPAVQAAAAQHEGQACLDALTTFTTLRRWKDAF